jgi:hypothetical protein
MSSVASEDGEEWSRQNGLTKGLSFSHNLLRIFPPSLYAEHPEFFPLENGVRLQPPEGSYYWQPDIGREDVAAYAADAAKKYFDENPRAESFSLGVNDGLLFGESEELLRLVGLKMGPSAGSGRLSPAGLKWFRERPDYSPLVFTFMNRAADELAKSHPDKLLGALAYYWCENAPPFPVRRQVVPFLTADRAEGYDAEFWREEALLQRRWVGAKARDKGQETRDKGQGAGGRGQKSEARGPWSVVRGRPSTGDAGRLGIYDYLYGSGFLIPRIHTRLLAENLRRARRAGFTDYYAETHFNWGLDGPMPWLAAQLLQDPDRSPEALLDEYYRRFFREAAVPMRRFFERCERQWMTQAGGAYWLKHYRNESQADLFPSAVCRELRGLLADAASAAARDQTAGERVEFVSDAFGVTERLVAMQEAREELMRRVLRGGRDGAELAEDLRRFVGARGEFETYTRALQAREPLAVAPFQWGDYFHDDPVPAALREIAREARSGSAAMVVVRELGIPDAEEIMRTVAEEAGGEELLRDGALEGALRPAQAEAGLNFEVALPPAWLSVVEPSEHFAADRIDGQPAVLRLKGNKNTQVYQWSVAQPGKWHVARMAIRGRVSASDAANLVLGWLDADSTHLGLQIARLPEGEWPDWVELELEAKPPEGAKWVGIGLRVQNQSAGDWIEAREFSLKALP